MPLMILGLLVIVGILIYAFFIYENSEEKDTRTVRERYPHVFEKFDDMKKGANYTIIEDDEEKESEAPDPNAKYRDEDGHTLHFPDDAEVEKRKRNIH